MQVVAKISPTVAVPVRLEGRVELTKGGMLSITYKQKGMVKTNSLVIHPSEAVAYMEDESAGFAIVLNNEPIAQFFGTLKSTNEGGAKIETPEGQTIYVNGGIPGVLNNMSIADEDSREARQALRAAKVKSKVKVKEAGSKKKKSKSEDAPKKKKKKK